MNITLQLFGAFRKYSNKIELNLPDGSAIKDLRVELFKMLADEDLGSNVKNLIDSSRFANDETILDEGSIINERDDLAILPPVSGG